MNSADRHHAAMPPTCITSSVAQLLISLADKAHGAGHPSVAAKLIDQAYCLFDAGPLEVADFAEAPAL